MLKLSIPQILSVNTLNAHFKRLFSTPVQALDNISFAINQGENLGIVGEIGSGKSTLSRLIVNLNGLRQTGGEIRFYYRDALQDIRRIPDSYFRHHLQLVFQDCGMALNPRLKIYQNLEEVYRINYRRDSFKDAICALTSEMALGENILSKYPADLSGGTQRRVFLARAMAALGYMPDTPSHEADSYPKLLILDELTRSLDAPLQHKILNFLAGVQPKLNLTYLIISHDFKIIRSLCRRVLVMHRGRVVEQMDTACLQSNGGNGSTFHPYTKFLLGNGCNGDDYEKTRVGGNGGCYCRYLCQQETDICSLERPNLVQVRQVNREHLVTCHRYAK